MIINGVIVSTLRQIEDSRGAVLHVVRTDAPDFKGFAECYCSEVIPGAVKAWKRHERQTQTFAVPVGRIKIAIYDDRPNSSTCGALYIAELGRPDAYFRLQIPPGLWYGFACLSDRPALVVNCADMLHDPHESGTLPSNSKQIPHSWEAAKLPPGLLRSPPIA